MTHLHSCRWPVLAIALLAVASNLRAATASPERWSQIALDPQAGVVERTRAFAELRAVATEQSIPGLVALLNDPAWSYSARSVLETIPGPAADRALLAGLEAASSDTIRAGLLQSLGNRRHEGAISAATRFLGAADPSLAGAALNALGNIGTAAAADALEAHAPSPATRPGWGDAMLRVAERLPRNDARRANGLYRAVIVGGLPPQRAAATISLARLSAEPATELRRALASSEPELRQSALSVLRAGEFGRAFTVEVGRAFSTFAPERQVEVLSVLYDRGDPAAVPIARAALQIEDPAVRAAGAKLLSRVGEAADAPGLLRMIVGDDEPAPSARLALSRIRGEETTALLVQAFRAGGEARPAALEVLVRRGHRPLLSDLLHARLYADPELGPLVAGAVLALASGADLGAVLEVHRALPLEARGLLEPPLRRIAAKHDSPDTAAGLVAAAAGKLPLGEAGPLYLILASIGGDAAFGVLTGLLRSPSAAERHVAVRALSSAGELRAGAALVTAARDEPEPPVRAAAVQAARSFYARIAAPGATPPDDVVLAAIDGLRQIWALAAPHREKAAVLTALRGLKHPAATAAAEELERTLPPAK